MKKAQTWYVDLFIGVMVFALSFSILMKSFVNISTSEQQLSEAQEVQARLISEMLLSEGYPANWTAADVIQPGFVTGGRLNDSKIAEYRNLNYNATKNLYRSSYDYVVYLENASGLVLINGTESLGKPGVTRDNIMTVEDPDHMMRIIRLTIYRSQAVRMVVLLWK